MEIERRLSQSLVLFGATQAPTQSVFNVPPPAYGEREAVFRALASVANAGSGYNITLGCDQAKVIARVMLDHERLLEEKHAWQAEKQEFEAKLEQKKKRRMKKRR